LFNLVFRQEAAMARNIEIKARIDSIATLASRVDTLAPAVPVEIFQDDTFFRCDSGRLKLRAFGAGTGELIYYRRANLTAPKESFYLRTPTREPDSLRESLSLAYGQVGRILKRRLVFIVGRTRIHLDAVEQLGNFLELEVVLADGEPADTGIRESRALMERLGIKTHQLIDCAYVDLIALHRVQQT
jgi:predicted adenylyl cyclase CyaB